MTKRGASTPEHQLHSLLKDKLAVVAAGVESRRQAARAAGVVGGDVHSSYSCVPTVYP
jgi:hypothetical protein